MTQYKGNFVVCLIKYKIDYIKQCQVNFIIFKLFIRNV